jgi:hypothetical protein
MDTLLKFTSALTLSCFWVAAREIASIEPWESVFPDPMEAIPPSTKSIIRLNCGLQYPLSDDVEIVKAKYEEAAA